MVSSTDLVARACPCCTKYGLVTVKLNEHSLPNPASLTDIYLVGLTTHVVEVLLLFTAVVTLLHALNVVLVRPSEYSPKTESCFLLARSFQFAGPINEVPHLVSQLYAWR